MKKFRFITYTALVLAFLASSCSEKNPLDESNDFYLGISGLDKEARTAVDQELFDRFQKPFNIEILYHWDGSGTPYNSSNMPPKTELVIPTMNIVENTFIKPYIAAKDSVMIKKYAPRQFVLYGSPLINPQSNVEIAGQAEGGLKIGMFDINNIDFTNRADLSWFMKTIHHEYVHILNQKVPFTDEFQLITKSTYTGSFNVYTVDDALERGYISPYSMGNPMEDFAELTSYYLTMSKADFQAMLDRGGWDGRRLLEAKLQIIEAYYRDNFAIDLHELQALCFSSIVKETSK
ncbi:putative zinc-binding metallopeptidase [Sphingobacterium sp. UT-1RO-CII-1]|uniref:substrate import-associated zinc metallohydrolase lipoprotein n=1 Tax=Sphingobacterium sp. UT-1RO-CII-1 TaxID=2995225 RepID=UPI00227ACEC2|nr:substrate import-associated zinc metallohydrolase lipoprotein [Sphingobacterium sp. UT-1RO-CII-1]MCY4780040.1 putative zinc-binding metallopeptidase [Sphingobacterium sp. UT-1RO-CII-1]